MNQPNDYSSLIKKIKRKRRIVMVFAFIAIMITAFLCSDFQIIVWGENILNLQNNVNPVITVLIILFILFCELLAYAFVSVPLESSMDIECDPQKHLALNVALNKQKNIDHVWATDLFFLGNFKEALNYADRMIANKKEGTMLTGLFIKARCEFFMGNFDSMKLTVRQFEESASKIKKSNQAKKTAYEKIYKTMILLIAIADDDKEKIISERNIETWNTSKAAQCYIDYLKGIAAYKTEDKEEAIYRLMLVKENGKKTVFAQMAEQYLQDIKREN